MQKGEGERGMYFKGRGGGLTLWGKGNYIFLQKYHCCLAEVTFQVEWNFSSF